jgi:hypothetical protein
VRIDPVGYRPAPNPITREEFARRVEAGARTFRELDPEFWDWLDARNRELRAWTLGLAIAVIGWPLLAPHAGVPRGLVFFGWAALIWGLWRMPRSPDHLALSRYEDLVKRG